MSEKSRIILHQDITAEKCFVGIKTWVPLEIYKHSLLSKKPGPTGAVLPLTVTHLDTFFANMPVVVIGNLLWYLMFSKINRLLVYRIGKLEKIVLKIFKMIG